MQLLKVDKYSNKQIKAYNGLHGSAGLVSVNSSEAPLASVLSVGQREGIGADFAVFGFRSFRYEVFGFVAPRTRLAVHLALEPVVYLAHSLVVSLLYLISVRHWFR